MNFKKLLMYIIITFLIGNFFVIFTDANLYDSINTGINVPVIVFPIVWTTLYLIMGITSYMISESNDVGKLDALKTYFIQLIVNSLWTLIFFGFRLYVLSFIWIILLIVLVITMIIKFYRINKLSGLLNIPYLLWLFFASILSFSIIVLN